MKHGQLQNLANGRTSCETGRLRHCLGIILEDPMESEDITAEGKVMSITDIMRKRMK